MSSRLRSDATQAPRTRKRISVWDRFWPKVLVGDGCWMWTGTLNRAGYGALKVNRTAKWTNGMAHRLAYEFLVGPIPEGLTLDHLCRVKACVNPSHLEPVTRGENCLRSPYTLTGGNIRKTHCPKGHPYSGSNLYISSTGGRKCRACHRERTRQARAQ